MQDIVFPDKNEAALIAQAVKLGVKELVFVYENPALFYQGNSSIKITNALFASPIGVEKAKNKSKFVLVKSSERDLHVVEHDSPTMIFDLESSSRHDALHQRAGGLNHILARMCAKNNVSVCFTLNSILECRNERRAQILGRMMQNISLCRKFKVQMKIATFAKSIHDLRNPSDLKSLFVVLGMHPSEAVKAL